MNLPKADRNDPQVSPELQPNTTVADAKRDGGIQATTLGGTSEGYAANAGLTAGRPD